MNADNEILNELKELDSPLAGYRRIAPYALPDGYLPMLAQVLTQGVKWSESKDPELRFSKAMPFSVPDGYLAGLPEQLAKNSYTDGSHTEHFEVPEGYFTTLPEALLSTVRAADKPAQKGKTIALRPRWQQRPLQWAAAAVIVLALGLGTYQYFDRAVPEAIASKQLGQLSDEAIHSYIEHHVDEFDAETLEASVAAANTDLNISISVLDEQEIHEYLAEDEGITEQGTFN